MVGRSPTPKMLLTMLPEISLLTPLHKSELKPRLTPPIQATIPRPALLHLLLHLISLLLSYIYIYIYIYKAKPLK